MLRFDNGITSVGLTSTSGHDLAWNAYPSLADLMQSASRVAPEAWGCAGGTRHLLDPVIDRRRLLLPTAAVSADPLHSTGIAHALAGVDRVAATILADQETKRTALIQQYRHSVLAESRLVGRMVQAAYSSMHDFNRFVAACMLYFAAAIACEERYGAGQVPQSLWSADDPNFTQMIGHCCRLLASDCPTGEVAAKIRRLLAPWNTAGLMDPAVNNRYAYTATK
jgi:FADH2 O2-dependent halogenase